ncbi:putative PurR-regulated permease PerM [Balneicella halophila]|uniref:Putative PurR-regulated permease PerM n=1 Tax=Balneicella halophila TaxID=1537566 RepID=A0A7L4UNY5_BALHA|nr:AI-2E family transporter [Balneicella halophila]PVX50833.1 putative PurR-regulated permease PerM [Balneicella halophila]
MGRVQKYIAAFLGIGLLIFCVWYFSAIVAYILIALVLSFMGRPLVEVLGSLRIGKFKIPRAVAALITLLVIWIVFILFFYYLTPLVINEFSALRDVNYQEVSTKLQEPIDRLNWLLSSFYGEEIDIVTLLTQQLRSVFTSKNTMGIFNSLTSSVASLFVALFSITFMTFFFLKDSGLFMKGVRTFTPQEYETHVDDAFGSIKKLLVRYFSGVFLESVIIFILLTIGFHIVGIPTNTALVIALLAGCLNIIPYLGPLTGAILGILIVLLNNVNLPVYESLLPLLGFTAMTFAIVQLIDNMILQPLIYSSSVYAHPMEIFLLILIAGSLAGPVGMILAVPAYTILRVVGYEFFAQYSVVKKLTKGISYKRNEGKGAR